MNKFPSRMTTGALLLLSTLFIGMGIFENGGLFSIFALTWMMLGFTALIVAALGYLQKIRLTISAPSEQMLIGALLFFLYITMFRLPGAFIEEGSDFPQTFFILQTILIVILCCVFFFIPHPPALLKQSALLLSILVAILLRIWILSASPAPQIDVFAAATTAAMKLLRGVNPYTLNTTGIAAYYYPPTNIYLHTLSYAAVGDTRAIYVLAESVFAACLFLGARRSMGSVNSLLLASLFLFQPRSLNTLELAWTEPPILAFLGLSLFSLQRGWGSATAAAYGLMISLKQYLIFFAFHYFLLEKKWGRFALMIAIGFITTIPFLIWDAGLLINHGFLETLRGGIRTDSLTFVTLLYQTTGLVLPRMTSFIVGLIASILTFFAFQKSPPVAAFLFASSITTFALFLFGAQAFANYYYIVSGLVLLLIAYHADRQSAPSHSA